MRKRQIGEADDALWDKVLSVNVLGMVKLTRAALPLMLPTRNATIVNITSEAGLRGSSAGVAYTASMPEIATPEQLAASITFLLSDDSTNINGAVLPSDGGWSAQ